MCIRDRARTSDAILILGGDGTFVGVGRKLAGLDIPLLGINFGQDVYKRQEPDRRGEQLRDL